MIDMAGSWNSDKHSSWAMLLDLKALDCPICYDALTAPIYQCENGHIVCSICFNKLNKNKCPSCTLPIGHIRCRALENIIEGVLVPCPNVKLGCTKRFSFGKDLSTHREKDYLFSPCSCLVRNCDYTGLYKDVYTHFGIHMGETETKRRHRHDQFVVGKFVDINFVFPDDTSAVMEDYRYGLLFIVQCFKEPYGVCVTVSCIAPCAAEVGEFSCYISTEGNYTMTAASLMVKRIRKLSHETPKEDFLLVPSYGLRGRQSLKLKLLVRKVS